MADRAGWLMRWLARIFPREFRERVIEPAYDDLLAEELATTGAGHYLPRPRRLWSRAGLILACFRVGLPRFFWNAGRPTVLTNVIALMLIFVGVFMVWVSQTVDYPPQIIQ